VAVVGVVCWGLPRQARVTQATIHQRLRDEHGLTASVASLKRYVAANLPKEVRRDRVVVLRDEADTPPGEEAQIDYGHLGHWVDPTTGKRRRVWAFAMVLASSRHMFVRPVLVMDQRACTSVLSRCFIGSLLVWVMGVVRSWLCWS
jgi:hypothetical protein